MRAITISRQYGSGGGEIGARLAARLNWRLIDHELVARVAQELGITERTAEERDEYTEGFIARLLGRQGVYPSPVAGVNTAGLTHYQQTDERRYQETLRHVVETAADSGLMKDRSRFLRGRRKPIAHS
jgi:cytidylate kinase